LVAAVAVEQVTLREELEQELAAAAAAALLMVGLKL
jgi:hypothetical protein